eukprot:905215-Prymnesium_polylepis.1
MLPPCCRHAAAMLPPCCRRRRRHRGTCQSCALVMAPATMRPAPLPPTCNTVPALPPCHRGLPRH